MARDDDHQVIPAEIRSLIERRMTFQGWLTRLDELGSDFRPEVTARVREDYERRLASVESELAGHRTVLESSLAEHRSTLDGLLAEHDARTAQLEECDLRHRVGEYDEEEWERRRKEHRDVLDGLEEQLARERGAVGELEGLLAELSGTAEAAPAPLETETGEGEREAAPDLGKAPEASEEREIEGEPAAREEEMSWATEELAPSREPNAMGTPEIAAGEERAAPAAEAESEFMDELEFLESLSLDDTETFDAVSAMLEEEGEGGETAGEGGSDGGEEPEESA